MLIKFYVEAQEEIEAINLVVDGLDNVEKYIIQKKISDVLPYWKENGIYIVEIVLELHKDILYKFLSEFSDTWLEFGYPVDELLASKNNESCSYMKMGFVLINIFL